MALPTYTPVPGENLFDRFETLHQGIEALRAHMALAESLALLEMVTKENTCVTVGRDDLSEVFGQWRNSLQDLRALGLFLHEEIHSQMKRKESASC